MKYQQLQRLLEKDSHTNDRINSTSLLIDSSTVLIH